MRVLFLTHRLPFAPNRGDRIRAYHILHALVGHVDVELISLVHDDEEQGRAAELGGVVSRVTTARVGRLRSVRRGFTALVRGGTLTHALLDAPGFSSILRSAVAERPPDLVFAYCSGVARYALEPPLESIPLILDLVDVDSEKWAELGRTATTPMRWLYAREARLLSEFEARAVRRAALTFVVNEREHAALHRLVPEGRIHTLPNGVDLERFEPPEAPTGDPRVVFCGVMNYRPNEEAAKWLVRQVWPLIRAKRRDARLTVVGSRPTSAVRKLAEADGAVEVTGTVPDVRPYLWRSAVAVAPLAIARGLQNKVLEAIAAGLPTVVTPVVADGLPPEALPACRVAQSADDFASAVLGLLDRPAPERRAMARRGAVSSLGWSSRLAGLPALLTTAMQRGQAAATGFYRPLPTTLQKAAP